MTVTIRAAGRGAIALLGLACLAAQAQDKPVPCSDDPIFQQQDFTVGHWDVYKDGQKTAEVRLEKALKDCAIHETWTPVEGKPGNGLGLFTYSRLLKSWGYFWVADTGQTTHFAGALQSPGNIRYQTEAPLPNGGRRVRHWSLILQPDGSVRELSVGSNDGKTWTTEYDLLWRKKT
jgi:hypothetical protein